MESADLQGSDPELIELEFREGECPNRGGYLDVVSFDADAPAGSVFLVETVRVPRLRNALRVVGAVLFGFLVGDPVTAPSSQRFQVRMNGSNEVLNNIGWAEGRFLVNDLETLTAVEFAERWLPQEEAVQEEG